MFYSTNIQKTIIKIEQKDNFVSIGLLLNNETKIQDIKRLHSLLNNKYNYFEIILLNYEIDTKDYSNLLKELNNIRIIELSSYVDIEVAHSTLIENCIGDYCAIIDLSHDSLEDLEKILEYAENYDVVVGKREKKVQSFFESISSKIFYKTISLFTGIKIDSMYSDFFVINRKVINFITKNEDRVKFLKLLKFNNGFSKYEYTNFYTKLNQLKHDNEALWNLPYGGEVVRIGDAEDIYAFKREKNGNKVVVMLNFTNQPRFVTLLEDVNGVKDIYSQNMLDFKKGEQVRIEPWEYIVASNKM